MLYVKTDVGPSQIHGLGLIAKEPIKAGQLIWEFKKGFDQELTQQQVDALSEAARETVMNLAYYNAVRARYVLCADNGRFMNHSSEPNTLSVGFQTAEGEGRTYAARDIEPGEELTEDYGNFETRERNEASGVTKPLDENETSRSPRPATPTAA